MRWANPRSAPKRLRQAFSNGASAACDVSPRSRARAAVSPAIRPAEIAHRNEAVAAPDAVVAVLCAARIDIGHDRVVRRYYAEGNGASAPTQLLEKRALFFASEAGHEMFQARLGRPRWKQELKFEIICDREIRGPWSQYATVWRSAARPPSDRFVRDDETYFFW